MDCKKCGKSGKAPGKNCSCGFPGYTHELGQHKAESVVENKSLGVKLKEKIFGEIKKEA